MCWEMERDKQVSQKTDLKSGFSRELKPIECVAYMKKYKEVAHVIWKLRNHKINRVSQKLESQKN